MFKAYVGALVALAAVAAFTGCKKSSEVGGGAGSDTFQVVVPSTTTAVKQGEFQSVTVSVKRGDEFKQAVKLEFKSSTGIAVDPESTTVQPGDKADVQLKISAAQDAPLGESKILVKGTPDKGEPAATEFTVTVSAK